MLIKGASNVITYTVYNRQTGMPITGVTNHTITLVTASGTTSTLAATVTEIGNGQYSFVLPATNTNADALTLRITSATPNATIPPIVCHFTTVSQLIPSDSAIYAAITAAVATTQTSLLASESRLASQLTIIDTVVDEIQSSVTALTPKINAVYTKLDTYPIGTLVAVSTDIPTASEIATSVLTSGCTDTLTTASDDFSLASLIMSSFNSAFDLTTNTWTIKKPDGTTLLTRHLTTSDTVKSITEVKD